MLDSTFVGLPGQLSFFRDRGNLSGFEGKLVESLDLATGWGYAKDRVPFDANNFEYEAIAGMAGLDYVVPDANRRGFNEAEGAEFMLGENLDPNTIVSFSISFEPNQNEFTASQYGAEFQRALKAASTFGNARVVIRGHSDPTKALGELIRAGIAKGLIRQTGTTGNYRYFYEGKPLDIDNTPQVVELIESGAFSGGKDDPAVTLQAALNLSKARAEKVKEAIVGYAKQLGANVDLSQIVPIGAGISDPIVPKPTNMAQAKENMRVEFRIVRVDAESIAPSDFDF